MVVVGAAHLKGIQKWLAKNGTTQERMLEISTSGKDTESTWPGQGKYCDARADLLFYDPSRSQPTHKRLF